MGFSIRKRTRGKTSWLNLSASTKKGVHASYSQKLGDLTLNFSKNNTRATYNFGNGVRWTGSTSNKKPKKPKQARYTPSKTYSSPTVVHHTTVTPARATPKRTVKSPEPSISESKTWILIFIMIIVMFTIQLYMKGS